MPNLPYLKLLSQTMRYRQHRQPLFITVRLLRQILLQLLSEQNGLITITTALAGGGTLTLTPNLTANNDII